MLYGVTSNLKLKVFKCKLCADNNFASAVSLLALTMDILSSENKQLIVKLWYKLMSYTAVARKFNLLNRMTKFLLDNPLSLNRFHSNNTTIFCFYQSEIRVSL